jgi:C4-dicarboxylate-specific signal transduction histidine kinase
MGSIQIEQVLLNLLRNAMDAMGGANTLDSEPRCRPARIRHLSRVHQDI